MFNISLQITPKFALNTNEVLFCFSCLTVFSEQQTMGTFREKKKIQDFYLNELLLY